MMTVPSLRRRLPPQDQAKVLTLAEMWARAAAAHEKWATAAKACVDFVESRQWDEATIRILDRDKRPHLTLNKIARLVRLVLGYHRNNRTDLKYLPGYDGTGDEQTAEAVTRIVKQISENCHMPYVDTEVFMDGIIGGRGFYDTRLDYENNDLGEARTKALDPFTVYLDPDGEGYDLDEGCSFLAVSRRLSIDELDFYYGSEAAAFARPFLRGQVPLSPIANQMGADGEITPVRAFGSKDDATPEWWDTIYNYMGYDFVDPYRKTFRVLDFQYRVTDIRRVFVDLETGDRQVIPTEWGDDRIQKCLYHAERIGNPLTVDIRPVRLMRWTTLVGDVMLYDKWSPYDGFTVQGFFPYFRRGQTRGMVEDLMDPQREVNRRRTAEMEIVSRSANGGYMYHDDALDPVQEQNLKRYGSRPGVTVKVKAGKEFPKEIQANTQPIAHEKLEDRAANDLQEISGINESALGELDRVQSGRAIEARQRQAVIAIQMYMDNFSRTKELLGGKLLEIIQKHYTEPRMYRILGEDGKFTQVLINQQMLDPASGAVTGILNDVTRGKYTLSIDETPLSASFASAQFEEALMLFEKMQGLLPPQLVADILVDLSSLPRKDEIKNRLQAAMGIPGAPMPGAPVPGGSPPGAGVTSGTPPMAGPALDQAVQPGGNVVPLRPA